jgi:hypothetical protein
MKREALMNTFADLAKEYCGWVEGEPETAEHEHYLAVHYLARLYSAGLEIPLVEPVGDFDEPEFTQDDYQRIHKRFAVLPFQYYYEVFNPFDIFAEKTAEPEMGDVCDDLTDIYGDLKRGLILWEKGERENAVFIWNTNFGIHWGRHATSALRALHCFEYLE